MCFSAGASFGVSIVLLAGGVAAIKKVQRRSQIAFAALPLLFSIQQFTEGVLWLSVTNPAYSQWHTISTGVFLFFAQVLWPVWVPLSIWILEKDPARRRMLQALLIIGATVSAFMAYVLLTNNLHSVVSSHHIGYDIDFSFPFLWFGGAFYLICTIVPPFVSGVKKMPVIGGMLLASFLISKLFFRDELVSVWCFFAAAISLMVFTIVMAFEKPTTSYSDFNA